MGSQAPFSTEEGPLGCWLRGPPSPEGTSSTKLGGGHGLGGKAGLGGLGRGNCSVDPESWKHLYWQQEGNGGGQGGGAQEELAGRLGGRIRSLIQST